MIDECTVVISKPVSPIIPNSSVLGCAGGSLQLSSSGYETKTFSSQGKRLFGPSAGYQAFKQSRRAVDPVIEAVRESIHTCLIVSCIEARKKHLAHVSVSVLIRIFGVEDLGSCADECPIAPSHNPCRKRDFVNKKGPSVIGLVSVQVFKEDYSTTRLVVSFWTTWVVIHFNNPQFSVRTKINCDGVLYEWFRCHKLDSKGRIDMNRVERCLRWLWSWELQKFLL